MEPTYETITIAQAIAKVRCYNDGTFRGVANTELDCRARELFPSGRLGTTLEEIQEQVYFLAARYGGMNRRTYLDRVPEIAAAIETSRTAFENAAREAPALLQGIVSQVSLQTLYKPFVTQPIDGKRNWYTLATMMWHMLKPDSFIIVNGTSRTFFEAPSGNGVVHYHGLLHCYRSFILARQPWLERLQEANGQPPISDNKLWDKVIYGGGQ